MSEELYGAYHPLPFSANEATSARRKVRKRLRALLQGYDFCHRSVLDLGCNGGYFAFELSRYAKNVLAIDADQAQIERNRQICKELRITNVEFEVGVISPSLIKSLEKFDVTLLLSVVHHIIASSDVYSCNAECHSGVTYVIEILRALHERTQTIFFEMGQSDEAHQWASSVPTMVPSPDVWIIEKLLQPAGFRKISVIQPPEWQPPFGYVKKLIHRNMAPLFGGNHLIGRALSRITGYDTRDGRYIFMAAGELDACSSVHSYRTAHALPAHY